VADRGSRPSGGPSPEMPLVLPREPSRAEVEALCDRVGDLVERRTAEPFICDVGAVAEPDADTIDALARLQLAAVRLGARFRFSRACDELRDLLALTGLTDVLPCEGAPCDPPYENAGSETHSGVEPLGQPEQREHALRVEEERDSRDLPA